jgi:transposase InsO family protein
MGEDEDRSRDRWARLRFSIVGQLLAAPCQHGELRRALEDLAERTWRHPTTGALVRFGRSTIERWYYAARNERQDPVARLRTRVRKDAGRQPSLGAKVRALLHAQYKAHRSWSYKLHADNVAVLVQEDPALGRVPSYSSVRRYMKSQGLFRQRRKGQRRTPGAERAAARLEELEVRSYESAYVLGLWHWDFHQGSRLVLTPEGRRRKAYLLGVLDDCSRLGCHLQWYLAEAAQTVAHGLSQAFQKRGLPRSAMSDRGSAMLAVEIERGLLALGILLEPTLPYSPYQNGKMEVFWGAVEGRLMAMLEGCEELTLELLNEATQAWVELEYNRALHSELGMSPLERYLAGPSVGRECPSSDELRRAFRAEVGRTQRRSDGTLSLLGRRFEVPSRYRHLERLRVRYASWDLTSIDLVDPQSGRSLCPLYPLDKVRNADGRRRRLDPVGTAPEIDTSEAPASGIAPLLRKLMADYAATGLPPAYLPQYSQGSTETQEEETH